MSNLLIEIKLNLKSGVHKTLSRTKVLFSLTFLICVIGVLTQLGSWTNEYVTTETISEIDKLLHMWLVATESIIQELEFILTVEAQIEGNIRADKIAGEKEVIPD